MQPEPHPDRQTLLGRGIVYIAWDSDRELYTYYWDLGDPPTFLEQGPGTADTGAAIRWGLERTPKVILRPREDPSGEYWAGSGPSPYPDVPPYTPSH